MGVQVRASWCAAHDFKILAPDEVLLLAAHAEHHADAALFTLAEFSGLLPRELRGLQWRDPDFSARLIHVCRGSWRAQPMHHGRGLGKLVR